MTRRNPEIGPSEPDVATTAALPGLKSGGGLPSRSVVLCDGRTSLRAVQEAGGFDNLVHYSPDSWFQFKNVLHHEGAAIRWAVDGAAHRFDWMCVYPFGYENREERASGAVVSRCLVVQNTVAWSFCGVRSEAVLSIPAAMFGEWQARDDQGAALEVATWSFAPPSRAPVGEWLAVRREEWRFRDASTYAGIMGRRVASEDRRSELHLCLAAAVPLRVAKRAGAWHFTLAAAPAARLSGSESQLALVLAFGQTAAEAQAHARRLVAAPAAAWQEQAARYAALAAETPGLDFGRHTALGRFFRLQPGYLESMRIREEPGAYRANNDYYWVWGWDMTRPAFGLLTGNRHPFVRQLLDFVDRAGYVNQYDNALKRDLRADGGQPGALEYMLAHDYVAWTGDVAASRAWRDRFVAALTLECANPDPTGMHPGAAASTDFPEEFGRTFKGWLSYTTGWHYAGLLSAEKLLLAWGDRRLATAVREQALKIRRSFARVFWNPQTGFWNEGVHPTDPDLVCDIPLSTAMAGMDSPYGEDLYGDRLQASADFCAAQFLREDGVSITARGETRGWKEWTRQPRNWFAANDTMLVRLMRSTGNLRALERLFYLYEINFGYQPCVFEGKPLHRPLFTSGSWQAFGAGAWYRNLVEGAAGLWADLGGLGIMPGGLGEPVRLTGLRFRQAVIDFHAHGQGPWPAKLLLDGQPVTGTTRLPPLAPGAHTVEVEYAPAIPAHPLLTLAVDAEVRSSHIARATLQTTLTGHGYTPLAFFSPGQPEVTLDGEALACEWDSCSGRSRARCLLNGKAELRIRSV